MKHFETVEDFVARSKTATTLEELADSFRQAIHIFGFEAFVLSSYNEFEGTSEDIVGEGDFPRMWHDYFVKENSSDNLGGEGLEGCQQLPLTWGPIMRRDGAPRSKRHLFRDASDAGLGHGVSVPVHVWGRPSVVASVSGSSTEIDPSVVSAVHLVVMYMYHAVFELGGMGASEAQAARQSVP